MHASGPEFAGNRLADALRVVRRRIVINRWLGAWVAWSNWVLVVLIVLAAALRFLKAPLMAGAAAIFAAGLLAYLKTWYQRPSNYETAQRFDAASRQSDRISTAVHFWAAPEPSAMILQQREDALRHAAKFDPEALFPVEMPKRLAWTAGLAVAFAALCLYHANYGAPLPLLRQKVADSKTLAAILSPISRLLESATADSGKQSASLADDERRDASEAQKPPAELPPGSEAAKAAAALLANQEQQRNSDSGNGPPKGTMSPSGERQNAQVGQSNANDPNNQGVHADGSSQGGSDSSHNNDNNNQNQSASASAGNKLTQMAQRAFQALENMMQDALGKQANSNGPSNTPTSPQAKSDDSKGAPGGPQSSESAAQPGKGPPEKGDGIDVSTSNSHSQLSGVGNATQNWQLQPLKDKLLQSTLTPEHVALQSNGLKGPPGKDRADVGAGTAQVPLQNVAPPTVATVNGAGQDTVPARYQQYVRDYFKLGKR
jgi:hypothetical protein